MEDIVLIGFGGHAKSVLDSIERAGVYRIAGFVTPERSLEYRGYSWLGSDDDLADCFAKGIKHACICVGYLGKGSARDALYRMVKKIGFQLPAIIDPTAVIGSGVSIGEGTFVGKNAVINIDSQIGNMCIINSCALVEHSGVVDDFTHLAVGATLCGDVVVSDHCFIGARATIVQGLNIGKNTVVGAGSVVLHDVAADQKVYGIV